MKYLGVLLSIFIFSCQHEMRTPALVNATFQDEGYKSGLLIFLNSNRSLRCSATYVKIPGTESRRTFITAGHCLKFSGSDTGNGFAVFRTVLDSSGQPLLQEIAKVKIMLPHPEYKPVKQNDFSPYDIAVGVTQEDLPEDMTALELVEANWKPKKTATKGYLFIGSGFNSEKKQTEDPQSIQVRSGRYFSDFRIARNSTLTSFIDMAFISTLKPGDVLNMAARDDRDPIICGGDSGGTVAEITEGKKLLAGVLFSSKDRNFEDGPQCWWYPMYAVPVSPYLEWLSFNIKQLL